MIDFPLHGNWRCVRKFVSLAMLPGVMTLARHRARTRRGDFFPPFQFISVTDRCNLSCQGCWVVGKKRQNTLSVADIEGIISAARSRGSRFFGILGGEPLLHEGLLELFARNADCYFQLFTNGTLLDLGVAKSLSKLGNVTPLVSLEGDERVSDVRRGGEGVYGRTLNGIENATGAGLITGVAVSVCKSNIDTALSPAFIESLIERKVTYLWYYIFRPVGSNASAELALSLDDINRLRRHLIEARALYPIVIVDSYWDNDGKPFCPAAIGLSHHINASLDVEPCPVVQLSADSAARMPLTDLYRSSRYLRAFRERVPAKTRGCVLMEDPAWLASFAESEGAIDSSGRGDEYARLRSAHVVASHGAAEVIPERGFFYRLVKKNAFFGLGAYG